MRHNQDARVILVNKAQLINKIKENKAIHIKEYEQAIVDYREEAKKQLKEQTSRLTEGKLDIKLDLRSPVDNKDEYDKLVQVFEWEVKDEVELSQGEFNEYILDELPFAKIAKLSNTFYSKSLIR